MIKLARMSRAIQCQLALGSTHSSAGVKSDEDKTASHATMSNSRNRESFHKISLGHFFSSKRQLSIISHASKRFERVLTYA